jgi:DNA (cytosine-5)-methyltransferase 1
MLDVVRAVRPRFVVVENVPGLIRDRDAFGWMLGDLADDGFDAEWSLLRACALGAPHVRERLFVVAHANGVNGTPGLGAGPQLGESRQAGGVSAHIGGRAATRAWRDRVDRAVEASRADGRETHGSARQMVTAGGNAVVVDVAELIGRRVLSIAAGVA